MADLYWVGGTSTWNSTAGTKWATSSGGAGGAAIPTSADNVFFDANSGANTITLSTSSVARSVNCTGFTGTLSHPSSVDLLLGDGTAGSGNVALKFVAGMTYTLSSSTTSTISFASTSATVQTVDFGGKTCGTVTFGTGASGGSWQLTAAMTSNAGSTIGLSRGTLDTNGQTCSWGFFSSNNTNTRALTLGASGVTLTGTSGTHWNTATTTGLTFTPGTSTITLSYTSTCTFAGGGLTYNNLVINYLMGVGLTITGDNIFANLTITGTSGTTTNQQGPTLSGNITVTTLFTVNGLAQNVRVGMVSNTPGTTRTITAASVSLSNVDFMDIAGAGAAAPFTGASLGDAGGNSGITFTAAVSRYAVATGNWSSTAVWSASSGGASGATVPLPHDNVFLNAASGAITVTTNMSYLGKDIDCTGFTGTLDGATARNVFGSLLFSSGMTVSGTSTINFRGRGTHTLTSNGKSHPAAVSVTAPGGTYTLQDNFSIPSTSAFGISNGVFDANNFNVTCGTFNSSNTNTRTISMGTGTWTLSGTGTIWSTATSTNLTLNGSNATISITDNSASAKTFTAGAGKTFGAITIASGGAGTVDFTNSATYGNFTINAPKTVRFGVTTQTITGIPMFVGSAGNIITLQSTVGGSQFNLSKVSGIVSADYLSLTDSNATGGAVWYAGANSANVSNNSGWIFTAPSSGGTLNMMGV
ncbi:MAG TPA: hypothetical protein VJ836_00780 [Candidatus Saccharimonadales bacterium]|nr:hypothetical protein [Candidatus Saccharimonadales bacterium]